MERDDRPPVATFYAAERFDLRGLVSLSDAAAHHARVKRLEQGDRIRLTNGVGHVAFGLLAASEKRALTVEITDVATVTAAPDIHLRVPIGDRDRMLWLAEKATELGVTTWQSVRFRRSMSVSPRGDGAGFAEKIRARMISALEQSGGAWLPAILPESDVAQIDAPANVRRIVLDVSGRPLGSLLDGGGAAIVFGPEGGLEADESARLIEQGWIPASLAATTLRFETAGIAAVAVVRAAQLLPTS